MAKRKRGADSLSIRHLEKLQEDISRALKEAKGFERQRMSKRQRAFDKDPEKKAALERDINVLKSLDLHQTARAHLYSSLLRIKSIANHEDLPAQLKKGVAKPELAEDERLVLHNVTSGLYNRDGVKKAVDKAITFVCEALDIPVPQKGAKGKRERKEKTENAQGAEPVPVVKAEQNTTPVDNEDETDFEGFSADDDDDEDAVTAVQDLDSDAEVAQENDISVLDGLLGSSSDEDEDEDDEERARLWEKYRGKETVNLDDISLSGGDSEPDDAVNSDDDDEPRTKPTSGDKKVTSRGVSLSSSPEPQRKRSRKATSTGRPTDSTFLPSLMGGYVSGSESASDVDVAPPKKRRGQQARRAIWAQKYGSRAKHLQDAAKNKGRGRDDGWDMKRGAVDAGDSRTPWKKGVKNPFSSGGGHQQETRRPQPPPPKKRDDQGPLHPSWEARKKAKESQKAASFAGSKVVFD
ncbi:Bud-site selection protein, BUD22 [Beauveria brongniartii RCEF 3172]|uniref:Bud-site selection protein, BUD22 n=1 Tax=Beauveria brongniartii RCEF 3172 TaxID=1081107 RepID=A0A162HRX4_9HYPO|nr:Bud-site selection protein, BUD22 [Beauveria brongniartii RCEF 3172]